MKSLVGIDYANGTYKRYVVTLGKVKAFLLDKYKKQDIAISKLNHAFIASSFIVVIFQSFSYHTEPVEVHTAAYLYLHALLPTHLISASLTPAFTHALPCFQASTKSPLNVKHFTIQAI